MWQYEKASGRLHIYVQKYKPKSMVGGGGEQYSMELHRKLNEE